MGRRSVAIDEPFVVQLRNAIWSADVDLLCFQRLLVCAMPPGYASPTLHFLTCPTSIACGMPLCQIVIT